MLPAWEAGDAVPPERGHTNSTHCFPWDWHGVMHRLTNRNGPGTSFLPPPSLPRNQGYCVAYRGHLTLPATQSTPFMASLRYRRLWEGVSKSCIWREGGRKGLGGGGEGGRSGRRGMSTRPEIAQPFPSLVITAEGVTA